MPNPLFPIPCGQQGQDRIQSLTTGSQAEVGLASAAHIPECLLRHLIHGMYRFALLNQV